MWYKSTMILCSDVTCFLQGGQGQRKAKPLGFIFSNSFLTVKVKFEMVLKQFKLNIMILFLSES